MIAAYSVAFCAAYCVGVTVGLALAEAPRAVRIVSTALTVALVGGYGSTIFFALVVGR